MLSSGLGFFDSFDADFGARAGGSFFLPRAMVRSTPAKPVIGAMSATS